MNVATSSTAEQFRVVQVQNSSLPVNLRIYYKKTICSKNGAFGVCVCVSCVYIKYLSKSLYAVCGLYVCTSRQPIVQ